MPRQTPGTTRWRAGTRRPRRHGGPHARPGARAPGPPPARQLDTRQARRRRRALASSMPASNNASARRARAVSRPGDAATARSKRSARLGVAHQALQDHPIQIPPVGNIGRQRLRAQVGRMRALPLLPRLQRDPQPAGRQRVGRPTASLGQRGRQSVARGGWKRLERDGGRRRHRRTRLRLCRRARLRRGCKSSSTTARTPA